MERRAPTCTLRETAAFVRDPAEFTAGEGLRLGDLYGVRLPGHRIFVVTDPELIERILVRDADCFVKGRIYWRELRRTIGDSMGSMDGDRWGYLHRLERPHFTPKAVGGYGAAVERHVTRHVEALLARAVTEPELSVLDALVELNARVILAVLFGQDSESSVAEVTARIADGHEIIASRTKLPWRRFTGWLDGTSRRAESHRRFFDGYVSRLADAAERTPAETLVHTLLRIREDTDAPEYSDALMRNEIVFHLGASTETQAAAEGWTLYLLWRHPEALRRIREEVGRTAGAAPVSFEDIPELPFTRRVVQEALRLYPPVYGVMRDCARAVDLGGHRARPGCSYLISVYGLHRSPRIWSEPLRFQPDRFAAPDVDGIGRYDYLPFGAGKHVCIGQHLAMAAMVLTIAQLAQRTEWTFLDREVRAEPRPSLKPSGAFRARFSARTSEGASLAGETRA